MVIAVAVVVDQVEVEVDLVKVEVEVKAVVSVVHLEVTAEVDIVVVVGLEVFEVVEVVVVVEVGEEVVGHHKITIKIIHLFPKLMLMYILENLRKEGVLMKVQKVKEKDLSIILYGNN